LVSISAINDGFKCCMLQIVRTLHDGSARVAAQATPDPGLLAPFHPFAVADATNLSALE
jgi:hypothetical protein